MALRLTEKWVWDFWLARDGADYHLFYLQAPRSLVEQQLRHLSASIGHAVSKDLENWRVLPDALHPGPRGAWDEDAVWTRSVVRRGGTWHIFYTGVRTEEGSIVQRVGSPTSTDLTRWRKHQANPLIEADPRHYGQRDEGPFGTGRAWRDPWIFRHPRSGDYHALITARAPEGPFDGRGA